MEEGCWWVRCHRTQDAWWCVVSQSGRGVTRIYKNKQMMDRNDPTVKGLLSSDQIWESRIGHTRVLLTCTLPMMNHSWTSLTSYVS